MNSNPAANAYIPKSPIIADSFGISNPKRLYGRAGNLRKFRPIIPENRISSTNRPLPRQSPQPLTAGQLVL